MTSKVVKSATPPNAGSTPAPATKFDKKAWQREYMRSYRKGERRRGSLTNPPPSPKPHEGKGS